MEFCDWAICWLSRGNVLKSVISNIDAIMDLATSTAPLWHCYLAKVVA